MSDTWMYSSASGSKVPHSLSFPNEQWFFPTVEHRSMLLHSPGFPNNQWFSTRDHGSKSPNGLQDPIRFLTRFIYH